MANYSTLKAAIDQYITANGNNEITGTVLNNVLDAMVNSLGANYQFAGVATPSTNPGTPDQNVFYLAFEAGTYVNFNGAILPAGISVLTWNGSWASNIVLGGDGVFDISAYRATGGTLATYVDLAAALDGGNNVPQSLQKGGMSVKFVQSSDNKYVQYRLMSDLFNTTPANWQGVDDTPTPESDNLVKSGGVYASIGSYTQEVNLSETVPISLSSSMQLIWVIDTKIKAGQKYTISVLGTFEKSLVRVYANEDGPVGPIVYSDNDGTKTELTAAIDINKLYFHANCTTAGNAVCTLNYIIPAIGLSKDVESLSEYSKNASYYIQRIVGGANFPDNFSTDKISISENTISANKSTSYPLIGKNNLQLKAGKKYYVYFNANFTFLSQGGITLRFRGIKYQDIDAKLGTNEIAFYATPSSDNSVYFFVQFAPSDEVAIGDQIIAGTINYFSVVEVKPELNMSPAELRLASEKNYGLPMFVAQYDRVSKWTALGDSLTAGASYMKPTMDAIGIKNLVNLGVGGKQAGGSDGMWKTDYLSQIPNDTDLITLMCGTNDWANSRTIGNIDSEDTNTYCGALNTIIDYITQNYPAIRFVIMCPPIGIYPDRSGWSAPWIENINGDSMMDFAQAAYNVASNRGIACARIGQNVGWNEKNISTFVNFDGAYLHPNTDGGKRISDILVGFLRTILPPQKSI